MKFLPLLLILGLVAGCSDSSDVSGDLKTKSDSLSYSLGFTFGTNFKDDSLAFDADLLIQGFRDGMAKDSGALNNETIGAIIRQMQTDLQAQRQERAEKKGVQNLADGKKFLAENKSKPGVVTTASGLQYKVLKQGNGASPTATDMVTVHLRGTTLAGKEFVNTAKDNKPLELPVQGVMPGAGFAEMLQLMKAGSKCETWIPSDLAYGKEGGGGPIGQNETIHFEIELIDVKAPQGPQPGMPPPGR